MSKTTDEIIRQQEIENFEWTLSQFQRLAKKNSTHSFRELPHNSSVHSDAWGHKGNVLYLSQALMSEAGELGNLIKKYYRDNDYRLEDIISEMGDVLWYLVMMMYKLGVEPDRVMRGNIEKLIQRNNANSNEE